MGHDRESLQAALGGGVKQGADPRTGQYNQCVAAEPPPQSKAHAFQRRINESLDDLEHAVYTLRDGVGAGAPGLDADVERGYMDLAVMLTDYPDDVTRRVDEVTERIRYILSELV
jgi:hypothetical protein